MGAVDFCGHVSVYYSLFLLIHYSVIAVLA